MLNRQQKSAALVQKHLEKCPMPRNQVAARSGLSNPYIKDLESGHYKNVDRNKLISLAIGLSLSLGETDALLNIFDRMDLTVDDIPLYIQLGHRVASSSAMLPMRGGYQYELALLSTESIPGDLFIMSAQPTSSLCAAGHRWYTNKLPEIVHPLYGELIDAINNERSQVMIQNLKKNQVEHYICKDCLKGYIHDSKDDKEKSYRHHHIQNIIHFLKTYENFHLRLIDPCSRAHFTLKNARSGKKVTDTVLFYFWPTQRDVDIIPAQAEHTTKRFYEARFNGFTTSNPFVMTSFYQELAHIKNSVMEEYAEKEKVIEHLTQLISKGK